MQKPEKQPPAMKVLKKLSGCWETVVIMGVFVFAVGLTAVCYGSLGPILNGQIVCTADQFLPYLGEIDEVCSLQMRRFQRQSGEIGRCPKGLG